MTHMIMTASNWLNDGLFSWFRVLKVRAQARVAARNTVNELSRLTDRELNDLGISRGQIRHLANKHRQDIINDNLKGWV